MSENLRNQNLQGEREILVVSFGTSYAKSRQQTIGAIEAHLEQAFPEWEVRRAFTSRMILKKLRERDGLEIDSIERALERAAACGVRELVVQPTHLMSGREYTKVLEAVDACKDRFLRCAVGAPLLSAPEDFGALAGIVAEHLPVGEGAGEDSRADAAVIMGHGTDVASNEIYVRLQEQIRALGYEDHYIATVESTPSLEDICGQIRNKGYHSLLLAPLMIVAGDHANNDLAGEDEDSWKTILGRLGYETRLKLTGLGELAGVQALFAAHVSAAMSGT